MLRWRTPIHYAWSVHLPTPRPPSTAGSYPRTLLDALVRQRRLTRNETRELLTLRAAGMGVTERRFALSERQFYRLLGGEVKTRPHPVVCRVIEAEFGYPVEALLGPFANSVPVSRPAGDDWRRPARRDVEAGVEAEVRD